jgi:polyhydroxybutyrate depolymerase
MSKQACQFRRVSILGTGAACALLLAGSGASGCGEGSTPTGSGGGNSGASGGSGPSTGGTMPEAGGANGGSAGTGGSVPDGAAGSGAAGAGAGGSGGARPTAGCGKAPPASNRYSVDVAGTMREYILTLPENYDLNQAHRLIFGWHPRGGSAQMVAGSGRSGYYGLQNLAAGSAIFVAPEGIDQGWANTGGRDIAFLRAMLDRFRAELCIDDNRIFSTGFSYGGMMSFAVGCAMGGVFRAIAPMAGALYSGCVDGTEPMAVLGFHGVNDNVVPIANGRQGRDVFIERNQCTQETMPVTPSWCDGLQQGNQPCSCVSYQGCAAGYPVIWCEFNGTHTPAPNSAATIWSFFSQF